MKKFYIKKLSIKIFLFSVFPILISYIIAISICLVTATNFAKDLVKQDVFRATTSVSSKLTEYYLDISNTVKETISPQKFCDYLVAVKGKTYRKNEPSYNDALMALNNIINLPIDGIKSAWLADFSGNSFFTDSTTDSSLENQNFSSQIWYNNEKISSHESYVALGSVLESDSNSGLSMIFPIRGGDGGNAIGVYGITVDINTISELIGENIPLSENGFTAIVSSNGTFVYHDDKSFLGENISVYTDQSYRNDLISHLNEADIFANAVEINGIYEIKHDGENLYVKYLKIPNSDFSVYTIVPENDVSAKMYAIINPVLIFAFIGFLITISLTFFLTKKIINPIKRITSAAKAVCQGSFNAELVIDSGDEIGTLVKTFNQTIKCLNFRTTHDPLTQIYNSIGLHEKIETMFIENPEKSYSLIRMDIDKFKVINDLHGWDEGDNLLRYIARVIDEETSEGSVVGRANSDIFLMCIDTNDQNEIDELLTRIKNIISEYSMYISVMPYFGVFEVTDRYASINMMYDRATLAVKSIKGNGVRFYAYYDDTLRKQILLRKKIESDMNEALLKRQFFIMVQPKCDIKTGKVVGGEALVRWNHPVDGLIRPDVFIPVFEQNGFVVKLDEFVWEETCKLLAQFRNSGYDLVPISVNVSRVHIFDAWFCDKITRLVEKYKIPPKYLELEFTESAFLSNLKQLYSVMETLKSRGFTLSMDDFASGYSSLNMLKNAPFDVVKIDREFITETVNNTKGRKLICGTISLIHQLDMKIVAEGVETREQADFLSTAGCIVAQGYLYSKPIKTHEFELMAYYNEADRC